MVLELTRAQGALTGERYIASLRDGREVWLNGERVDVTTHPAFVGNLRELARLYDLQHTDEYRDTMTYVSPTSGNRISYSYSLPHTQDDLLAKRRNFEIWMAQCWGQLGRSPDFCSAIAVGIYDYRADLGAVDPRFAENAANYWRFAAENDICLTHVLGDPQMDRTKGPTDNPDMSLRVIEERPDGIVVRGAKQLATLGPTAQEALVYLSASFALREQEQFVQWFAIPMNAPGLKLICREPLNLHGGGHSHPLATRFDEMDALMIFDDVFVPFERIFLLRDGVVARKGLPRIMAWASYSSQIRFLERMRVITGVACLIAEAIGIDGTPHVREKLGEMITYTEMARLGLRAFEADCRLTPGGLMAPGTTPALGTFSAMISARLVEILRQVGTSGLMMQPTERDLATPALRPYLDRYMHGREGWGVVEKSRLFRLGWELAGSDFGMRQELYERLHRGDLHRNLNNLFAAYDRADISARLRQLIAEPLPSCCTVGPPCGASPHCGGGA